MAKVLFADDEAVMRMAFRKMIDKAEGFELCATVAHGGDALAFAARNAVDVVVTDLRMPVIDGVSLIRSLRAGGYGGSILAFSNYSDFGLVREALVSGADDYMLKTETDDGALVEKLNKLTQKRAAASVPEKTVGERRLRGWFSFEENAAAPENFEPSRVCLLRLKRGELDVSRLSCASRAKTVVEQVFANIGAQAVVMGDDEILILAPVSALKARGWRFEDKLKQVVRQTRMYSDIAAEAISAPAADSAETARRLYELCANMPGCRPEVRDAIMFVHTRYEGKITLDDVAGYVNLSGSYLCRVFKSEMGVSLFRYINDLRMKKAAELIETGARHMRDVAACVGIGDQLYFSRMFKKRFGVSPSEYAGNIGRGRKTRQHC